MPSDLHPITAESFAIIDREIGSHSFAPDQYQIVRRVIHATADFEFKHLLHFSDGATDAGITALTRGMPLVVDVRMVQVAIAAAAGDHPIFCALDAGAIVTHHRTRTAVGMAALAQQHPEAIFVVGNAPTALLALAEGVRAGTLKPALIVGVPVGFVQVEEAKQALAALPVPQIRSEGRKGGSPVAAAVVNALFTLRATRL
jgi:precorrin-8X/cobalt-precorrin-8 methylmutase